MHININGFLKIDLMPCNQGWIQPFDFPSVIGRLFALLICIGHGLQRAGPAWLSLRTPADKRGEVSMLWTICVILIVLWLLGLVTSYTMGGLIHILLVIAIIVVLVNVIQGRRPL